MKMSLVFASFTIFFTENAELVTTPLESLPTRQNGVENCDKAYSGNQCNLQIIHYSACRLVNNL